MCEDFEVEISCKKCRAFWLEKESKISEREGTDYCEHCGEELSIEQRS